tara:strand:- start:55 stop:654 length:600 start_codon:yes stop_codon:yes gene_type:complete
MKAQIPNQKFRKADYNVFPTLVQVHHIDCDTKIVNAFLNDCDMDTWPEDIGKGTTSSRQVENLLHINEFEDIRKAIEERLDEYCDDVGLERVDIGKAWINDQAQEGYVASHRHELSIVSGAYYPIVEEGSASIVFDSPIKTPRMAEIHNKATDYTADKMEFEPKSGMLILFPSWLYHYSLPNKTDKRVTISFNTFHKNS